MAAVTASAEPRRRRVIARALKVVRVVAVVLGGLVLLLAVVLGLPPTREFLLRQGLGTAADRLPGELAWRRAAWPEPGRIELDDLLWTDRAETLACAALLRLEVQVLPLLRGEVVIDTLRAGRTFLDLGRIQRAMPPAVADTTDAAADTAQVRKLPDAAVRCFVVRDLTAVTPSGSAIRVLDLDASLELRAGHERSGALAARFELGAGLATAWRLSGRFQDGLAVEFSPLTITDSVPPAPQDLPLSGRLQVPCATVEELRHCWTRLTLENLTIMGALGDASVSAHLAGADTGRVDVTISLRQPPVDVARALAGLAPEALRARVLRVLTEDWPQADPHLDLRAAVLPPPAGRPLREAGVVLAGDFTLPGPADLLFLLPDTLQIADLGTVAGRIGARWDGRSVPATYAVALDLDGTQWLEAGRLRARGWGRAVLVEELAFAMQGLRIGAAGELDSTLVNLMAEVVVANLDLVRRWPGLLPAQAEGHGTLTVVARGNLPLPEAEVSARGGFSLPQVSVPSFTLDIDHADRRLVATLSLPEGVATGARKLDAVALDLHGDLTGYPDSVWVDLRGRVVADTSGAQLSAEVAVARRGGAAPAVWARVDSLTIRSGARAASLAHPFTATFDPADSSLVVEGLRFEGRFGFARADARAKGDSLSVDLDIDLAVPLDEVRPLLPPEQQATLPRGTAVVAGQVLLRGTPSSPQGSARLELGLRDVPRRPPVALRGTAWLLNAGEAAGGTAPPSDAPASGLAGDFELAVDGEPVLGVIARLPAEASLRPLSFTTVDEQARFAIRGERIQLDRLAALLPSDLRLTGRLAVNLTAAGPLRTMDLGGRLEVANLRLELADGSWFNAEGAVAAAGTVRAPDLDGAITIESGLMRVPEAPPDLLPANGKALLRPASAAADTTAAGADTTAADAGSAVSEAAARAALHVTCPGNLWLRGRGFDLELEGDIRMILAGGATTLDGEMSVMRGTFRLLGRVFTLERGTVDMFGDVRDLQLRLDVSLTATLETTQYWVRVTGSPTNLNLELTSNPEMSEGDIMAALIFGKPLDELDEGQADLVAQRSKEIAAAYGAERLQNIVAGELGLDLVRIDPHTEDASATTLTVGKYLSPKVIVSYEQTLANLNTFVVHLEYLIKGGLKIHSAVSQGEASGAEVLWSRDY